MRKISVLLLSCLLMLLAGCLGQEEPLSNEYIVLPFNFDGEGNYTGFTTVTLNYTIEQAIENGFYVRSGAGELGGNKAWQNFIENSSNNINSSIRIMHNFDDTVYFLDLFYVDGSFRVFHSLSDDLTDHKFDYILELDGRVPNSQVDSYFVVLTDDSGLSFDNVVRAMISSNLNEIASISQFRILFGGARN